MSWFHDGTLISWDLETTGVDVESDRIVTASRWIIRPADGFKKHAGWLVNPGIPIPDEAAAIHGITTEHARAEGQDPARAVWEIAGDLTSWATEVKNPVFIAFNAAYDTTLLHRECLRHGHTDLADKVANLRPFVDPLVLDKQADAFRRGSRKLTAVAKHYDVELSEEDAHGSAADSLAAARVAYVLARKYPGFARKPADELHDAQRGWRAEQAQSLQKYLRKKDKDAVVDPHWPLKPLTDTTQEQIR